MYIIEICVVVCAAIVLTTNAECPPCEQLQDTITLFEKQISASGLQCPVCVPCTICEYGYKRQCTEKQDAICSDDKLYEVEDSILILYGLLSSLLFLLYKIL
jgi:hypothetical protein